MEETAQQSEKKSLNRGLILIIFVVIIVLAIVGYEATKPKTETSQTAETAPTTAAKKTDETATDEAMTATTYKNGTYKVLGNYTSPGGAEEIDVTIILTDDVITDATVVAKAERPISKQKQADFIANFEPQVIGKKIDEVKLDKISGSSLTPKGFNNALEKIKEEAKA